MREIYFPAGCSVKEAVEELIQHRVNGESVFGNFNGHKFYSDTVTLNYAYLQLTGKNYGDYEESQMINYYENRKRKEDYKKSIPSLTAKWIEKGHKILDEKYWEKWDKCVPIRLSDLYQGMELQACLDIIEPLNNNCTLEEAKEIIYNQDHSGMSFGLVREMVKIFCDRGKEFAEYVKL